MKTRLRTLGPAVWLSVAAVTGSAAAVAQDSSTYYTMMHPEEFEIDWGAFYREAERRTAALRERLPHHLDLAYGDDPKQRLDLYLPEGEVGGAPVFLFLHGGGFREGDRAQYGGDREAIWVGGHSAGAILAADLGVDRAWMDERDIPESALRGIAPISGSYDLRGAGRDYTPTADAEALASPMLHIEAPVPAAVVAVGSVEENYLASSREFVERLGRAGVSAELIVAGQEDHRDTVTSLGNARSRIFREILAMIRPAGQDCVE